MPAADADPVLDRVRLAWSGSAPGSEPAQESLPDADEEWFRLKSEGLLQCLPASKNAADRHQMWLANLRKNPRQLAGVVAEVRTLDLLKAVKTAGVGRLAAALDDLNVPAEIDISEFRFALAAADEGWGRSRTRNRCCSPSEVTTRRGCVR